MVYIILIILVLLLGVDTACQIIIEKTIPKYKRNLKTFIPGYNIYMYYKWKKEIKQ
jgi:hypothetical protein